jgi:hypothetical protein
MHNPYKKQSIFTSTLSKRKRNNVAHFALYQPYENTPNKKEAANITCDSDSKKLPLFIENIFRHFF